MSPRPAPAHRTVMLPRFGDGEQLAQYEHAADVRHEAPATASMAESQKLLRGWLAEPPVLTVYAYVAPK